MHPEMSLVFLTVLAGAGQGIFMTLVALDLLLFSMGAAPMGLVWGAGAISLVLPSLGVVASFFHLGNPMIGYKAVKMFNKSWLSKEVVFLPLFLGFAFWYFALFYMGAPAGYRLLIGVLGTIAGFGAFVSSAMLYAKIRYVREWANPYTVINFCVFGILSGAGIVFAVMHFTNTDSGLIRSVGVFLIMAGMASLVLKVLTYRYNATLYAPLNEGNALGINNPTIKMMDMGTSYAHYNTEEFYYPMSGRQNAAMERYVLTFTFLFPTVIWLLITVRPAAISGAASIVAAVLCVAGLLLERRLFFIQGNHLQNLYYGNFKKNKSINPLVSKTRKNHPSPI